jgi:hypothetical protein
LNAAPVVHPKVIVLVKEEQVSVENINLSTLDE